MRLFALALRCVGVLLLLAVLVFVAHFCRSALRQGMALWPSLRAGMVATVMGAAPLDGDEKQPSIVIRVRGGEGATRWFRDQGYVIVGQEGAAFTTQRGQIVERWRTQRLTRFFELVTLMESGVNREP